jgi:phosphatidate cytidylyltransferase
MIRLLSALVLLPLVIGTVWLLPPVGTLVLALIAAGLAFLEYAALAAALGVHVPRGIPGVAVLGVCAALGSGWAIVDVVIMTALIGIGAVIVGMARVGPESLHSAAAAIFPLAYIGLPLGALAAVRASAGREAVLLIMGAIVISDSAQYYTGRAFGKHPLAPTISPKKTVEGAIGGVICGALFMAIALTFVFPSTPIVVRILLGLVIVFLGIAGDLFESRLKRVAGLKDSSTLIPGHGGVLDRIDALLFAIPVFYYMVLQGRVA